MKLEYLRNFSEHLGNTLLSIVRIIFLSHPFRNYGIKAINHNDLVILTNGPSLNQSIANHLSFLTNKDLLCVNFFPNTSYYEQLKPSYHVISAPELWMDDAMPPYPELSKELFENISKKTTWQLVLFIPFAARKYQLWQTPLKKNPNIKIVYYNPTPVDGFFTFCRFIFNLQLGMPRPHNVLIPSLMLSIYMRYKTIYILGADHSWLKEITVDQNNQVLVNQKHFYDENTAQPKPMNKLKGTRKLHEVLTKFLYTFKGYHVIEKYAKKEKVNIYNATPLSYIDAFERYNIQ